MIYDVRREYTLRDRGQAQSAVCNVYTFAHTRRSKHCEGKVIGRLLKEVGRRTLSRMNGLGIVRSTYRRVPKRRNATRGIDSSAVARFRQQHVDQSYIASYMAMRIERQVSISRLA